MKILHVVYAMNLGGIENWLMHLYREIANKDVTFDFLVNQKGEGYFDKEIKELGGKVIYGGHFRNPLTHLVTSFKALGKLQKYDAIHIHNLEGAVDIYLISKIKRFNNLIFHSHNDFNKKLKKSSYPEKLYLQSSNRIINRLVKNRIAVSKLAGDSYFTNNKYDYIPIGEDFSSYRKKFPLTRESLGIGEHEMVITHTGRFTKEKNHIFLINIVEKLIMEKHWNIKCIFIGTGTLEKTAKKVVAKKGLSKSFLFLGVREDVPAILKNITDLFLFPSLYEGLGLAMLEAQAAAVPVVCSTNVPNEGIIISELVHKVDLDKTPQEWAKACINHYNNNKAYSKEDAISKVLQSPFNIKNSVEQLIFQWKKE